MKFSAGELRSLIREAIANAYDVLGVDRDADEGMIKRAYKRLALQNHPDLHPGSGAEMVKINVAKDVLLDPKKRQQLDAELGSRGYSDAFSGSAEDFYKNYNPSAYQRQNNPPPEPTKQSASAPETSAKMPKKEYIRIEPAPWRLWAIWRERNTVFWSNHSADLPPSWSRKAFMSLKQAKAYVAAEIVKHMRDGYVPTGS